MAATRFQDKLLPAAADRGARRTGGGPGGGSAAAGGGGGGGGGRGRGPQRGPQGVDALWGAQRVMRQRINRMHYSFYDTFGDSALNARPYSLYEANPPKISGWTESAGFNMGGPLKIPHIYDGTRQDIFLHQFWRHMVAQPGGFVRHGSDGGGKNGRFQRGQRPAL